MRKQLFYIHGAQSFSNYDNYLQYLKTVDIEAPVGESERPKRWTDTLRDDLGEGWEVFMPTMPGKDNARYEAWKIWFERHFQWLRDGVVLLGWSQGGYFLAKYLVENDPPVKVKALFLLAAPFEPSDFGGEDGGDFAFDTTKVSGLAKKAENIFVLHSEDDPVVPYRHALAYKKALPTAELVTFTDKNHFLLPQFPELVQRLRKQAAGE